MIRTRSDALLVYEINTGAGGGSAVTVINSSNLNIANSAGWIVSVSNTGGSVLVSNTQTAINIINSAGWVMAQSNTSPLVQIQNSAGWIIDSMLESSSMGVAGVARTPGFAIISVSATDNTIVSAVADRRIRVLSMDMMAATPINGRFQSGVAGTNLTGYSFMGASGGLVRPFNPAGWFQTATNTLLNLNLTAAQSVGGCLTYLEI